uniref:Dynein light chain n=1 Tax=Oryctolagus cuniculus TaxID=9986 RepID=A0A5F9D7N7_RABIT
MATTYDRKAVIKYADMSEEMQQDSVECATQALEKYNIEKDIAAHIKKVRPGPGQRYFLNRFKRISHNMWVKNS